MILLHTLLSTYIRRWNFGTTFRIFCIVYDLILHWQSWKILFYSLYLKLKIHHLRNKLARNSETSSYFRTIRLWLTYLTHAWKCISLCIPLSLILIRCWFVDINQGKSIYLKGMKGLRKYVTNIPGTARNNRLKQR